MAWTLHTSKRTGKKYWFNPATNETKWADDDNVVASHYNAADAGVATLAVDAGARAAINFCKAAMLQEALPRPGMRVLDLCCGRGGDLGKLKHQGVADYHGIDIAADSLAEANNRAAKLWLDAKFTLLDVKKAQAGGADPGMDLVMCMLAMNYFFGAREHVQAVCRLAASALAPGGKFIGLLCDGDALAARAVPAVVAGRAACGGALWRAELQPSLVAAIEAAQGLRKYGLEYSFSVASGLVEACPEFVASISLLEAEAAACGLRLARTEPLPAFMAARPLPDLRASMRVPAALPPADADLVSLYTWFEFIKL